MPEKEALPENKTKRMLQDVLGTETLIEKILEIINP
jgi:hypothetical protein